MSKPLVIGDEIYNYPTTGEINYGEDATGWAEAATGVIAEVSGPGDIPTTEVTLSDKGATVSGRYEGNIVNLSFDTAYVQSIKIGGHITRTYTDATPDQVEYFEVKASYNGSDINFSVDYTGDDTEFEFGVTAGQFTFSYLETVVDELVTIKYSAKTKVDEAFFA